MKCIAIDDEPIALSIVASYCQQFGDIALTTYTNPLEGIAAIKQEQPDVVFLDIEMNDYSGIELARELPNGTLLIFTTAHARYALDGYEVNAVDFLHKPFAYERFEAALSRVKQILAIHAKAKEVENTPTPHPITIKTGYQNVTIHPSDIVYIEAMDNYIKINTTNHQPLLTKMSIKCFMEMLPPHNFIRIHRSYVVAKQAISSYTKQQVWVTNQGGSNTLPVGRIYSEALYSFMLECK